MLLTVLLVMLTGTAWAQVPFPTGLSVHARNPDVTALLSRVSEPGFWEDATANTFENRPYDLIRLKSLDGAYVPMIAGESDLGRDVVARAMFDEQVRLLDLADELAAIALLGQGTDEVTGAAYRDYWYLLDLKLMYAAYAGRVYWKQEGEREVVWFEKLMPEYMPPEKWRSYEATIAATRDSVSYRALFNSVVEVEQNFGVIIAEPGTRAMTRVHFVSRTVFGSDAGWMVRWSSQLPLVIKSTLKGGLEALWDLSSRIATKAND